MNLKAFLILLLLVAMTAVGSLGCGDDSVAEVVTVTPDGGTDTLPPLPPAQACPVTEGDIQHSIGVSVCGDGVVLTTHDPETGYDVKCYRCQGEFNASGTQPVPAEGCFVWRHSQPIAGLCVNSCVQCGSTHENY